MQIRCTKTIPKLKNSITNLFVESFNINYGINLYDYDILQIYDIIHHYLDIILMIGIEDLFLPVVIISIYKGIWLKNIYYT